MHRRQTFLLAPRSQRTTHAADRPRRILPAHDRLVEYPLHAALRGEFRDAERILLPLVGVTVNVDGVLDSDHVVKRGIDGLFEAAASRIRCDRANRARRGVIGSCVGHCLNPPGYRIDWTISRPWATGKRLKCPRNNSRRKPTDTSRFLCGLAARERLPDFVRGHG